MKISRMEPDVNLKPRRKVRWVFGTMNMDGVTRESVGRSRAVGG